MNTIKDVFDEIDIYLGNEKISDEKIVKKYIDYLIQNNSRGAVFCPGFARPASIPYGGDDIFTAITFVYAAIENIMSSAGSIDDFILNLQPNQEIRKVTPKGIETRIFQEFTKDQYIKCILLGKNKTFKIIDYPGKKIGDIINKGGNDCYYIHEIKANTYRAADYNTEFIPKKYGIKFYLLHSIQILLGYHFA